MSHTESSTVTKSNVNPGRGFLRDIPSQNTYREGMPRGTRDTNSGSDTDAENTAKGNTSEHPSGISVTNTAREKPSRKRKLEADSENEVSEKEDDEYVDFKRFFEVPKHDGFK